MIYGNKEGVRDSLLAKLETLYDLDPDIRGLCACRAA